MDSEDLDPWPDDNPHDLTFDPQRPRFADVPLLVSRAGKIEFIRGHLPDGATEANLLKETASFPQDTVLGYFPDGSLYQTGDEIAGDPRIHRLIDGPRARLVASDLPDASDGLRKLASDLQEYATQLEHLQSEGWRLIDTDGLNVYVVNMKYREQTGG